MPNEVDRQPEHDHSPGSRSETYSETKVPLFGARRRVRELARELEALRRSTDELGLLSAAELQERCDALSAEIDVQQQRLQAERAAAEETMRQEAEQHRESLEQQSADARRQLSEIEEHLQELQARITVTEEVALLQEVGVFEYRHPLSDAVEYQGELKRLKDQIRVMTRKDGGAISATTNWTVNGSVAQGRRMVRETSKLMLRAYNAEADNLVRGMKPYKLDSAVDRLTKAAATIERLGTTMQIQVSAPYHRLRVRELELTADYLARREEEKERERAERQRLREEQQAQRELEAERRRLEKERQHYTTALDALIAKGDDEAATRLRELLADVQRAIEEVDYRAANVRAGYVYVISNIGAFGERMVKIGMTRRLDPMDRVRELGDASVPFRFDVHAVFFSADAVGIEAKLHERLADHRVNRVNVRREFFYTTPPEVKAHLADLTGELLTFEELPEALEYRQSVNLAMTPPSVTEADSATS